jgi:hypothetical protein
MQLKGKHMSGRPRSRWEQQVRKDITRKDGRTWEVTEEEGLWEVGEALQGGGGGGNLSIFFFTFCSFNNVQ